MDAHTYAGWTYDYYFKRFGRRGLDDADLRIPSLVHPVRRDDIGRYSAAHRGRLLPERVLCRRRDHGVRRGPARRPSVRRPDLRLPRRRPRRRGPRADPRRHRLHVEPRLRGRVGRAQRVLLGHDGGRGRVLLPARGRRAAAGRLPPRRGRHPPRRRPLDGEPGRASATPTTTAALTGPLDGGGVHVNSGDPEPRVLPRHRGRHEPHLRPRRRRAWAPRGARRSRR